MYGGGGGFNQGYGGGFNQGNPNYGGGFNQGYGGGGGFINLGGASNAYGGMNNSGAWNYNGVWSSGNDDYLRNQIDRVYMQYDFNRTGQLQGQQFSNAYRDLCISVGQNPPNNFYSVTQAAMQADTNFDGRVNKFEMFNLFKRCQFNLF